MAIVRTTKALAKRINLSYFKKPHPFRTLKKALVLGLPILALIWIAVDSRRSMAPFVNGGVSSHHQLFGVNCEKCHTEWGVVDSFINGNSSIPNHKCESCHQGPPHHWIDSPVNGSKGKPLPGDPACMDCHSEHRGQDQLSKIANQTCLHCHKNLDDHVSEGYQLRVVRTDGKKMRSFSEGHPEFAAVLNSKEDTARIKLNHQKHLKTGLGGLPDGKQKLLCKDCHQVDGQGSYMQPIQFENHCKSCHLEDLAFKKAYKDFPLEAGKLIPHKSPDEIQRFIHTRLHALVSEKPESVTIKKKIKVRRKKKTVEVSVLENDDSLAAKEFCEVQHKWLQNRVDSTIVGIFKKRGQTCKNCHYFEYTKDCKMEDINLPRLEPSAIPARWFNNAQFRHEPHRMLTCTACHEQVESSEKTSDILLPGITTCLQCHNSEPNAASASCVECHKFHQKPAIQDLNGTKTITGVLESYSGD